MKLPQSVHKIVASELDSMVDNLFCVDYAAKVYAHEQNCGKLKELLSSLCDNDVTIIEEYHKALVAYQEVYYRLVRYLCSILYGYDLTSPKYDGNFVVDSKGNVVKPEQRHASAQ